MQEDIKSMPLSKLKEEMKQQSLPAFRAAQIYGWLHQKLVTDFDEMTNLSKELREQLKKNYQLTALKIKDCLESQIDGTRKYLFELSDGNMVESVLMKYSHGNSVCISSQVGCRMACRFCASGIGGLTRSLTAGEMLDQIYQIQKDIGARISNVVVMGTGEPLDNYENLLDFIRILSDKNGLQISQRNITVSTSGLIEQMKRLAEEKLQITLALSLHASNQEKRLELMPVAGKYPLHELIGACRYYFEKTGRRITFEYSLVKGVNDREVDAEELALLIKGMRAHVNLIPVNPIKERNFQKPDGKTAQNFKNKLEKKRINVTIRREMGQDINGACGQLRKSYIDVKAEKGKNNESIC